MMKTWRTNIHINNNNIGNINKRGIFQGDSLSSMVLLGLKSFLGIVVLLKKKDMGYKLGRNDRRITHLLYMDDFKVYADTSPKPNSLITTIRNFSEDIGMAFEVDKCSIINIKKGKTEYLGETEEDIIELGQDNMYKCLGIPQNMKINHNQLKEMFTEKYRKSHKDPEHQNIWKKHNYRHKYLGGSCAHVLLRNCQMD